MMSAVSIGPCVKRGRKVLYFRCCTGTLRGIRDILWGRALNNVKSSDVARPRASAKRPLPPGEPRLLVPAMWTLAPLVFGSGLCALIYQIAWQREFRLIFGASTAASAAVVAVFMGGLGLGGWVIGPRTDRRRNPLRFYAALEALVGLTSLTTLPLLRLAPHAYLALGGTVALGDFGGTAIRLVSQASSSCRRPSSPEEH
jgi:hypothetical protein